MANKALAAAIAKKQAELKSKSKSKPQPSTKETKKSAKSAKKTERKSSVERITDAKGREVTGRDNTFVCPECKKEITGPWSYKTHLVKQHKYSRKQAGLRPE